MKQPVDPYVLRLKQDRNKHAANTAFAMVGLAMTIATFSLCIWLAQDNEFAMFPVLVLGGVIALTCGGLCIARVVHDGACAIGFHNSYRWELNKRAWDAQQEELKRLRTIMNEEGL